MTQPHVPHFELQRVYDDGSSDPPEIHPVTAFDASVTASRRGFLGAGLAASAVVSLLTGTAPLMAAGSKSTGRPLLAHKFGIAALAISADGALLASASFDRTARLWTLPAGEALFGLEGHDQPLSAVAISPDGKLLATGSHDCTVLLWSLPKGQLLHTLSGSATTVQSLVFSPDGETLYASSYDHAIHSWRTSDGFPLAKFEGHTAGVESLALTRDGSLLFSGSRDATIKVWATVDRKLKANLVGHSQLVTQIALSADETFLISRSLDKSFRVWNLPDGRHLRTLTEPWLRVDLFEQAPGGRILAMADDVQIELWTMPQGKSLGKLLGHRAAVTSLAFTPDAKILASGDRSGAIILWDVATRQPLSLPHDPAVNQAASEGTSYQRSHPVTGRTMTYTLPCGSDLPAGAVCTCNCVSVGKLGPIKTPPVPHVTIKPKSPTYVPRYQPPAFIPRYQPYSVPNYYYTPRTYTTCRCVPVCTCIPVCQAHRVLDADPVVRQMAEEVLCLLGPAHFDYMHWAAEQAEPALQRRIGELIDEIGQGRTILPRLWPSPANCLELLAHPDTVVALMAAQLLQWRCNSENLHLTAPAQECVLARLADGRQSIWNLDRRN